MSEVVITGGYADIHVSLGDAGGFHGSPGGSFLRKEDDEEGNPVVVISRPTRIVDGRCEGEPWVETTLHTGAEVTVFLGRQYKITREG